MFLLFICYLTRCVHNYVSVGVVRLAAMVCTVCAPRNTYVVLCTCLQRNSNIKFIFAWKMNAKKKPFARFSCVCICRRWTIVFASQTKIWFTCEFAIVQWLNQCFWITTNDNIRLFFFLWNNKIIHGRRTKKCTAMRHFRIVRESYLFCNNMTAKWNANMDVCVCVCAVRLVSGLSGTWTQIAPNNLCFKVKFTSLSYTSIPWNRFFFTFGLICIRIICPLSLCRFHCSIWMINPYIGIAYSFHSLFDKVYRQCGIWFSCLMVQPIGFLVYRPM